MNRMLIVMIGSVVALVGMFYLLGQQDRTSRAGQSNVELMLFCAASNRAVMEEIVNDYQDETGRSVSVQYGASQTLLAQMEASGTGDLYLPADDSYLAFASEKELVAEVLPIARMHPVIAVSKDNPKAIEGLDDLMRDGVRLVQASPEAAAIGKVTKQILQKTDQWDSLHEATTAYRTTVTEAANDVLVGAADAAIVYDAVLHTYPDLDAVPLSDLADGTAQISIGVISSTSNATAALHLARFISARDRGLKHYQEHGFQVTGGDVWRDVPEISLFAGSMLRPAIEETIAAFEKREGVRIDTVYNGCGILVGQMKAGQVPDAYFACDTEFMEQVPDLFPESTDVSQNELVIIVQKGNPHEIGSLRDLTNPDLKVGVGHEKQCAMGWLTQNTLKEDGIHQEVMSNVTVQSPTGDMLVNQLKTGSLDAAVVYLSNAAGSGDVLDAVRIQGLECSIATQPYAVAAASNHAQTASRLFERICSAESKEDFAAKGFGWKLDSGQEVKRAPVKNE
ncbi:MAG: molybdate ABC transporter substrate-binding protein [Planctomycetota bacterium]